MGIHAKLSQGFEAGLSWLLPVRIYKATLINKSLLVHSGNWMLMVT